MIGRILVALFVTVAAFAFARAATAHAYLDAIFPADGAALTEAPREIRLAFSEPIEVRFSTFKVYPLAIEPGSDERRMHGAAAVLVSQVLDRRGDEPARVDDGFVAPSRTAREVTVRLRPSLRSGAYVTMWKVLSIDTHTTQDYALFIVRPR